MRAVTGVQEVIWRQAEELIKTPPSNQTEFYLKLREVNKMLSQVIEYHDNCVALTDGKRRLHKLS
jgi:hypothetical protein